MKFGPSTPSKELITHLGALKESLRDEDMIDDDEVDLFDEVITRLEELTGDEDEP